MKTILKRILSNRLALFPSFDILYISFEYEYLIQIHPLKSNLLIFVPNSLKIVYFYLILREK